MRSVLPNFDTPTNTIIDLLKLERVCSIRSVATCLFFDATGAYRRSFWVFLGVASESSSERILKISQHLPKLCPKLEWHVFFDSRCISQCSVATQGAVGSSLITFLQIYHGVCRAKNFKNPSAFGTVTGNSMR